MIDKNTGNVVIETIEFGPQHTKSEFKNDPKFSMWSVLVSDNDELGSFVLRAMLENGQKWVIAVVFYGEKLGLISLSHELPDEPHQSDWHNWQQETEDRRKAWHDAFLRDELGQPPYEYSWGDVDSFAETAGGRSAITVKYNTIRPQEVR